VSGGLLLAGEALVPVTVVEGRRISLTHLDRVLYPATGTVKAELVEYYAAVAPLMLPHLVDRPLTLVRFPDGVEGQRWVAKAPPQGMPSWVRTVSVPRHEGGARQIVVDSAPALVWAANLTGEFHTVQWRAAAPRVADRLVVDIDPGPGMDLLACRDGALLVRDRLAADGLAVRVKLSGAKGLHLLVGLEPTPSDHVSAYARAVAQELEREHPLLFTAVMAKNRRAGRLFLDWSQNNAAKTTAAPYTVSATTLPTVSAPVTWQELEHARSVRDLEVTIDRMPDRISAGDLLADLLDPAAACRLPDRAAEPTAPRSTPKTRTTPSTRSTRPSTPPSTPTTPTRGTRRPAGPVAALTPPLEVVRPRRVSSLPGERPRSGGTRYEIKLDGFRVLAFAHGPDHPAILQTRAGRDIAGDFPTVASAVAASLPAGTVVDGELCAWREGRLSFEDLLRTRTARARQRTALAYVVFDVLADAGTDVRDLPLRDRLVRLDALLRDVALPLQAILATDRREVALGWIDRFAEQGIEGVVAKPLAGRYHPGEADWVKYRRADTADATVLAIAGTARRPQAVLVRLADGTELLTSPALTAVQAGTLARELAGLLGPVTQHAEAGAVLPVAEPLLAEVRLGTGRHRTAAFVRLRSDAG
jgi:DNA ligase D-like protein (predicted polymerase)